MCSEWVHLASTRVGLAQGARAAVGAEEARLAHAVGESLARWRGRAVAGAHHALEIATPGGKRVGLTCCRRSSVGIGLGEAGLAQGAVVVEQAFCVCHALALVHRERDHLYWYTKLV